ncbi:MAG: hypothetical protein KF802_01245 [Bdellovibrionaceae bacterium]|nr:hypothetical protein [Pseudobdellovibrionaceae bacterium]
MAKSKEKIDQEAEAQVKRGRGRPPGTGKYQKAQAEAKGKTPGDQPSKPTDPPPSAEAAASMQNLTEEMGPILRETVKLPFSFAAVHFDTPEVELTEDEAKLSSYYLSRYIQLSMPELEKQEPKIFNLYAFLISLVLVGLKKLPHLMRRKRAAAAATVTVEATPGEGKSSAASVPAVIDANWVPSGPPLNENDGRAGSRRGF